MAWSHKLAELGITSWGTPACGVPRAIAIAICNTSLMEAVLALVAAAVVLILLAAVFALHQRQPQPFLVPDTWKQVPLIDKKELTHNTRRFR